MTGVALVIIGIAFFLKNLGVISSSAWGFIWPALLVALGIWFLLRGRGGGFFLEERLGWRRPKKKGVEEETRKLF